MNERGSATVVALGWIVLMVVLAGALLKVSETLIMASRLQGATDRAALAAADVLHGVGAELPCAVAGKILRTEQFDIQSCEVDGHSVRVISEVFLWGVAHSRRAHAGVVDGGLK